MEKSNINLPLMEQKTKKKKQISKVGLAQEFSVPKAV